MVEKFIEYLDLNRAKEENYPIAYENQIFFSMEKDYMFQLVFVASGTGMANINGNNIVFMGPTIFCLNEYDNIKLVKQFDLKAKAIYFNSIIVSSSLTREKVYNPNTEWSTDQEHQEFFYLAPFLHREDGFHGKIDVGISVLKKMSQLFESSNQELIGVNNNFGPCRSRSFFIEILLLIQYAFTSHENKVIEIPRLDSEMDEIILYLHTNYEKKITIDELTSRFHINRTTLNSKFNTSTGMSVIEYLTNLRIRVAAMMLRDTMLPVSEITYRCGFNDITHFGRAFKKNFKVSPSDYRKSYMV